VILKAAWIVPVSAPPIRTGAVRIVGERIAGIIQTNEAIPVDEPVTDLGPAILTPGLVNSHTHLELTGYAGKLAPGPLWDWLLALIDLRARPGQIEREQKGVCDGAWQSLQAGVTCVGDISRRNLNWQVLKTVPIRKVCFVELLSIADQPPRNLPELRQAIEEIEEDPLLTAGISPHAPYTVPPEQIRDAFALAGELDRPWCAHWAETAEECAYLRGDTEALPRFLLVLMAAHGMRSPRLTPMELLQRCSHDVRPGALAHFNYAEPTDAEQLAAAGHTVVYCPRAHHFFGHTAHPYRRFIEANAPVAIGTDSAASNENLALLEELRFLRRETPDPPSPATLWRMATIDAARALGLAEQIGSIEVGKQADLAAFPYEEDPADPLTALIERSPRPVGVWVAGKRVI